MQHSNTTKEIQGVLIDTNLPNQKTFFNDCLLKPKALRKQSEMNIQFLPGNQKNDVNGKKKTLKNFGR